MASGAALEAACVLWPVWLHDMHCNLQQLQDYMMSCTLRTGIYTGRHAAVKTLQHLPDAAASAWQAITSHTRLLSREGPQPEPLLCHQSSASLARESTRAAPMRPAGGRGCESGAACRAGCGFQAG